MAIIRVSILVDIDTTDTDVEDLRDHILTVVSEQSENNPELFLLKPLDLDDESDWQDFEDHPNWEEYAEEPVHPSFDPVFKNER
jgi:hypothetical protein